MAFFGFEGFEKSFNFGERLFLRDFVAGRDGHGLFDGSLVDEGHLEVFFVEGVVVLGLLGKEVGLAESNTDFTFFVITFAFEGVILGEVLFMGLLTLVGVNFEVIKVSAVGLPFKVIKNGFDFVLIKGEVVFGLLQESGQTVIDLKTGIVGLRLEGSGFRAHFVFICFVRALAYPIFHVIDHSRVKVVLDVNDCPLYVLVDGLHELLEILERPCAAFHVLFVGLFFTVHLQ